MWSGVNKRNITLLKLFAESDQPTVDEPIFDECYRNKNIYPLENEFSIFYKLWIEHDEIAWNAGENRPIHDRDLLYANTDENMINVLCRALALLTMGDKLVLDALTESNQLSKITHPVIKAFLYSQAARECVHNSQYSEALDVAISPHMFRNECFLNKISKYFNIFIEKYKKICNSNLSAQIYLVMLCEAILFSGAFYVICYIASLGKISAIRVINEQAMKDEDKHYLFYRELMYIIKNKMNKKQANEMLDDFVQVVKKTYKFVLDGYADDWLNTDKMDGYIDYIVYNFRFENGLYDGPQVQQIEPPAFMVAHLLNQRDNLMEGNSSIYKSYADTDLDYTRGW